MPPPLGVVKEKVTVLVVLVRRNCCAVGAAVRRAVDDEVPGAVEEETGPAAVRRVPSSPSTQKVGSSIRPRPPDEQHFSRPPGAH